MNFETAEKYKDNLRSSFLAEEKDISPLFVLCRFPHLEDANDSWCVASADTSYLILHGVWKKYSASETVVYKDYDISEEEYLLLQIGFDEMLLLDDQSKLGIYDGAWYELQYYDVNCIEGRIEKWGLDKTFSHLQTFFPSRLREDLGFSRCGQIYSG